MKSLLSKLLTGLKSESTDLSTLSAHRLRTVMPTEAFCRKGSDLHRNRPNAVASKGQRDASSWWKKHK